MQVDLKTFNVMFIINTAVTVIMLNYSDLNITLLFWELAIRQLFLPGK